jgi:soluble lytic murein transglycosylase-like protein
VATVLDRVAEIRQRLGLPASDAAASSDTGAFDAILNESMAPEASTSETPGLRGKVDEAIERNALHQGLDPALLRAVVQTESGFNPNAVSSAGAAGLMQLMPGTAKDMGVTNRFDPEQSLAGGSRYLKGLISKYQSVPMGLAAYNAGPGNVDKHGGIPPFAETQNYVKRVLSNYQDTNIAGKGH